MLFPGCFGMVLTIFQLARTPKTQYTVYKNMVLHKKWCINKSWVEHLFHDPLENEPLAA